MRANYRASISKRKKKKEIASAPIRLGKQSHVDKPNFNGAEKCYPTLMKQRIGNA